MTDGHGRDYGSGSDSAPTDDIPQLLSATDEAEITALLQSLPPVSMPDDLAERIDRAVAAEAVSRGTAGAATVVALKPAERRRWSESPFRAVAAGLIVVVAAGGIFFAVKASTTGSNSASAASTPKVTTSNHMYTKANLGAQVLALTAAARSTSTGSNPLAAPSGTAGPLAAAGSVVPGSQLPQPQSRATGTTGFGGAQPATTAKAGLATQANLRSCLDRIQRGAKPVALDSGFYNGQPALIIVLPSSAYKHAYSVYVVGANCGPSGDDFLYYQLVQTQ